MSGDGFRAKHHITVKAQDLQRGPKSQPSPTGTLTWRPHEAPERHDPVSGNGLGDSWHLQWKCLYSGFWSPEMVALGPSEELLPDILLPRPPDFIRSTMQSPKQSHAISLHTWTELPQKESSIPVVPPRLEHLTTCSPVAPRSSVLSFFVQCARSFS